VGEIRDRTTRMCERCGEEPRIKADRRYCYKCEAWVKSQMVRDGYLTHVPDEAHKPRGSGPRECGDGSWDNAVRAVEDG